MSERMMLAKNLDETRLKYPNYVSRKYDGVPGIYTIHESGFIDVKTRQGNEITSTPHIVQALKDYIYPQITFQSKTDVLEIIAEHVLEEGTPFKIVSGAVRKDKPNLNLRLKIFDINAPNKLSIPFKYRYSFLLHLFETDVPNIEVIYQYSCLNKADTILAKQQINNSSKYPVEGYMYKPHESLYEYKKSWNVMKEVPEPTIDLQIESYIQMQDKNKNLKDMLGSLIVVDSKGKQYNVGCGKMTHHERAKWFKDFNLIRGKIAVIKYKSDATYDGLRQPTFQYIHEDKIQPD